MLQKYFTRREGNFGLYVEKLRLRTGRTCSIDEHPPAPNDETPRTTLSGNVIGRNAATSETTNEFASLALRLGILQLCTSRDPILLLLCFLKRDSVGVH